MGTYTYNETHEDTDKFFKKDCWYRGKNGDLGITAKFSGNPNQNHGWWSGTFVPNYYRLVTPCNWEEITDPVKIEELEQKLLIDIENY